MNSNINDTKINQINKEKSDFLQSQTLGSKIDLNSLAQQDKKQEDKIFKKKSNKLFLNKIKPSITSKNSRRPSKNIQQNSNNNGTNNNNNQKFNCIENKSLQFLQINLVNKIKEMQNNKNFLEETEGNTNAMISESINKNKSNNFLLKENNINNIVDKLEKNSSEINKN